MALGQWALAAAFAAVVVDTTPVSPSLRPDTAAGWRAYVAATEARRAGELSAGSRFLVLDFLPQAAEDRRAVLAGAAVAREMPASSTHGAEIEVSSALVHHWRGAVLVPHVTVAALLTEIEHADPPAVQDDVLWSSVIARGPNSARVFLRLQRHKIVTVVYNTEHAVTFTRYDATRAGSTSTATKIAEVSAAGTAAERELAPGEDRGFLWRLNAYWRYQAVAGGVIAECESISLSRDVPFGLHYLVGSIVESAARESMEQTLHALRRRFGR